MSIQDARATHLRVAQIVVILHVEVVNDVRWGPRRCRRTFRLNVQFETGLQIAVPPAAKLVERKVNPVIEIPQARGQATPPRNRLDVDA